MVYALFDSISDKKHTEAWPMRGAACCIMVWQACQALLCGVATVPSEKVRDAKPTSDPVGRPWYISGFAAMPAKGKPLAMPLAKSMMSGTTPLKCWCAHHLPVLATPDCTCHQNDNVQRQHHARQEHFARQRSLPLNLAIDVTGGNILNDTARYSQSKVSAVPARMLTAVTGTRFPFCCT